MIQFYCFFGRMDFYGKTPIITSFAKSQLREILSIAIATTTGATLKNVGPFLV